MWAVLALCCGPAPRAVAGPVAFGSNAYDFVLVANAYAGSNNAWSTASAAAAASQYGGIAGHLATVTSQAENSFLLSLVAGQFTGFKGAWLGGKAPAGWLVGPEAGQSFGYTNWGGIEPNNAGYAYLNIGTAYLGIGSGRWADDSGVQGWPDAVCDPVIGYFVEYEGAGPVPEPGSLWLGGLGLAAAAAARRRAMAGAPSAN